MPDYKSMYIKLFNRVTDAVEMLQKAQQEGEEVYAGSEDPEIVLLHDEDTEEND
jgi:hypothetical protein